MLARSDELSAKLPASPCEILLTNGAVSIIPPSEVKQVGVSGKFTDLPSLRSSVDYFIMVGGDIPFPIKLERKGSCPNLSIP